MALGEGSPGKVLTELFLLGTSLVIQWLRPHAPNAGGLGSIPGQGTRSHMPQVLVKCSHAATKETMCCNQDPAQSINNKYLERKNCLLSRSRGQKCGCGHAL